MMMRISFKESCGSNYTQMHFLLSIQLSFLSTLLSSLIIMSVEKLVVSLLVLEKCCAEFIVWIAEELSLQ